MRRDVLGETWGVDFQQLGEVWTEGSERDQTSPSTGDVIRSVDVIRSGGRSGVGNGMPLATCEVSCGNRFDLNDLRILVYLVVYASE